ncbi:MAG: GntR family transcriptional regulator [Thermoleophilia bacterium]|jgi:DNA-binding GntR family transcriptional regulator
MGSPPESAKDRAYAFVKERVLDGVYPGGELLSEGEVAAELGLSRTPVREAFLLLEAEGLMRLYPKRGALVVPVSPDEVRDVMETRQVVERHAAARVATRAPEGVIDELQGLVDEQAARAAEGDGAGFVDADRRFHRTLVEGAGNAVLLRLYDTLRDRQRRMGTATVTRDPAAMAAFLAEHRAIIGALRAGNATEASERIERHIAGARARLTR